MLKFNAMQHIVLLQQKDYSKIQCELWCNALWFCKSLTDWLHSFLHRSLQMTDRSPNSLLLLPPASPFSNAAQYFSCFHCEWYKFATITQLFASSASCSYHHFLSFSLFFSHGFSSHCFFTLQFCASSQKLLLWQINLIFDQHFQSDEAAPSAPSAGTTTRRN